MIDQQVQPSDTVLRLDAASLTAFLDEVFPAEAKHTFGKIVSVAPGHVRIKLDPSPAMLRPGNIVSGPTLMGLADLAAYAVIVAHVGPVKMAVTTTLSINFLKACQRKTVYADARLLKLGRAAGRCGCQIVAGRRAPVGGASQCWICAAVVKL